MWWASSKPLTALREQSLTSPDQKRILSAHCLQTFPGFPACWPILQIVGSLSLHNFVSQFFKISLAHGFLLFLLNIQIIDIDIKIKIQIQICMCRHMCMYTHTHSVRSVSAFLGTLTHTSRPSCDSHPGKPLYQTPSRCSSFSLNAFMQRCSPGPFDYNEISFFKKFTFRTPSAFASWYMSQFVVIV